jgi:long-chain acyl-CoA synthetase
MNSKVTTTIGHSVLAFRERASGKAILHKINQKWESKSWPEYFRDIERTGAGFLSLGVSPLDRVAVMSNTRYEWSLCDYGVMGIHGVVVSIYQNNTAEDVKFILNNSKARILVIEGTTQWNLWTDIRSECPSVENVIVLDPKFSSDDIEFLRWSDLEERGDLHLSSLPSCYIDLCEKLTPEHTATLLYTSGTTGTPKGVVLTHTQIISEIHDSFTLCGVTAEDVTLSFLPYAHVMGRIEHWGNAYIGYTMAYAESVEKVRANLTEIRPTILISVPRIFEKIYSAIGAQMEASPVKKKLFTWAVGVGRKITDLKITRQVVPLELLATFQLAKKLVLNKVTDAFGGRLRFAISGGAPLSQDISSFFHAAGILILEGYGLTETTAAITVNTPFNYRFGSVGRPIGDTELKIAEDGEILVRGQKVMKEYYEDPAATAEVFDDGWFHTGDIGEILQGGDLKITDRKKDLLKTAGGKYVAPQKLEGLLKQHPLIAHTLICGDQKKYIVALLTLDPAYLQALAKAENEDFTHWQQLVASPWVQDIVRDIVAETNSQLANHESIKRYMILPKEFSVEGGELTPSLKLKRKLLTKTFAREIDSLYT